MTAPYQIGTDREGRPIAATVSVVVAALTLGYMLPWMVAALRGKSNHWAIFVLNLLTGWTVIGWIAALVLACMAHQRFAIGNPPQGQPQQPPA